LLLGVGIIHLIDRTRLESGMTCVTVCIAVVRSIQRGINDTERECDRGGKTSKARRILGKTRGSDKSANRIKVFKFNC
jgi:hypothetical protein